VCKLTATWPLYTTFQVELPSKGIILLAPDAASLTFVDFGHRDVQAFTTLPPANASDPYLGIVNFNGQGALSALWVVRSSGVYVALQALEMYVPTSLPTAGLVAGSPFGGDFGGGRLFVADSNSDSVYVISLNQAPAPSTVRVIHTNVTAQLMDMQYDAG
jgi:hypothetical protein